MKVLNNLYTGLGPETIYQEAKPKIVNLNYSPALMGKVYPNEPSWAWGVDPLVLALFQLWPNFEIWRVVAALHQLSLFRSDGSSFSLSFPLPLPLFAQFGRGKLSVSDFSLPEFLTIVFPSGRNADFIFFFLFGMVLLSISALFVNIIFLGNALNLMFVYLWARRNPFIRMTFFGVINFQVRTWLKS